MHCRGDPLEDDLYQHDVAVCLFVKSGDVDDVTLLIDVVLGIGVSTK